MQVYNILASKGRHVVTIHPGQTVREAVKLLATHNIGALVVVDTSDTLVGIISERDVVRRAAADEDVLSQPVQEVMTREVFVGGPQEDLMPVAETMTQKHIRHLPIVEAGKLVGILSMRDVLRAQRNAYQGAVDTLQIEAAADADEPGGL